MKTRLKKTPAAVQSNRPDQPADNFEPILSVLNQKSKSLRKLNKFIGVYPSGNVAFTLVLEDGKPNGPYTEFYDLEEPGRPRMQVMYHQGARKENINRWSKGGKPIPQSSHVPSKTAA